MRIRLSKLTTLEPKEIFNSAAAFFIAKGRWEIAYQAEDRLVLRHRHGPSLGLGCLLMLFMILPGILYLLLAKGAESSFTIQTTTEEKGTLVEAGWTGHEWWEAGNQFIASLPEIEERS